MKLSWTTMQFSEAFEKLKRAKNLEIEAIEQFHSAYEEALAIDNGFNDKTEPEDVGSTERSPKSEKVASKNGINNLAL
jgi:hypothetical protein